MLRLIIQTKRKYKKIEKQVIESNDEKGIVEKTENCSTDGQSTKSEDDVDSGVPFDEDSEKDIDTIEIEEEDWIDNIRRSTADALDKWNMQRFDAGTKHTKNEMEISIENRNITE